MPGFYTLEWRDGRTEDLFGHRGYYYVLPDRRLVSFLPDPAWCRHCGAITLCEHLRQVAEIEQELTTLDDPNSERSLQLGRSPNPGFPETWRQVLLLQLRHAQLRELPPSCLTCGQRDVAYFPEGEWAPHPGTGEEVRFSFAGMCSTDFARKFYDVDGKLLDLSESEREALKQSIRQDKGL